MERNLKLAPKYEQLSAVHESLSDHIGLELGHRFDKIVRSKNFLVPSWLVDSKKCDF